MSIVCYIDNSTASQDDDRRLMKWKRGPAKHRAIPQKTAVFSPASEWHGRRCDLVNAILLGQAVTVFSIVYALTPTNIIRRLLFWKHNFESIDKSVKT